MKREDTLPWYRQFWPWFIIALPASAVFAGIYTLWLAVQTTDSLVVQSEDGVNVVTARNSAAERQARHLGLFATIAIDPDSGAVLVALQSDGALDIDTPLRLEVQHPTLAAQDLTIDLEPAIANSDGTPVWAGHFVTLPTGRRYIILSSGDDWRLSAVWSGETLLTVGPPIDGAR